MNIEANHRKYKVGDFIQIRSVPSKYCSVLYIGDIGCVISTDEYCTLQRVSVNIYGKHNKHCADGHFNLTAKDVVFLDTCSSYSSLNTLETVNNETIKQLLNARYGKGAFMKNNELLKGYEIATVQFKAFDNNGYTKVAYALYDKDICVSDFVLCATGHHGEVIGQIVDIQEYVDDIVECNRQIICKIDYTNYNKRLEKVKRIQELKLKMAKKKEELNELAVYQALAATSPEMAEMLKELNDLI